MKAKLNWRASCFKISLFLIAALCLPAPALAQGITIDDTVEEGEVLEQNLIQAGPVVEMDGVINGDLVAVGDEIRINGEINGSLLAAGKQVVLNGPVTGSVYISSMDLVLGPQADIQRDVFFTGGRLETQAASSIDRDLNILALEAILSGNVAQEVNALVGPINLIQGIYHYMIDQGWLSQDNLPGSRLFREGSENQTVLGMAFGLPSPKNFRQISTSPAGLLASNAAREIRATQQEGAIDVQRLESWAVPFLRNLAALLLLGLLGAWLVPAQLSWAGEQARLGSWRTPLTGLLVFIFGWLIALLAFALIIVLAVFLYSISLPNLGFFAGTLGLTGLGLAVSVFWLSIAYFSKLIIAILVGHLLFKRFKPEYAHSRIWPLLTGVVIYALLASIPYLGWIVAVVFTLSGLGALWMVSVPRRLPERKSAAQLQPAGDSLDMNLVSEG